MRELIDCHVHTERCGHASGTVAQMISAGVFRGLTGMIMTEHLPLPEDIDPDRQLSMAPSDLSVYADEVREMAGRVRGVTVVLGAEADWLPERDDLASEVRSEARRLGVAILLGSVHFLGGWAFDNPHDLNEWDAREVDDVWTQYFREWCDAARSGMFDVMAHPDLPKKFGHRPALDPRELYAEAARSAAEGGVLIEVSTAGLRRPIGELYPGPDLLSAFRQAGVSATVGSDAHAAEEVGYRIDAAYDALVSAGYQRVAFPVSREETRFIDL